MYKCARCSLPATNGMHCDKHAATAVRENPRQRKAHHSMYGSKRWRVLRDLVLSEQPLCQSCSLGGRVSKGEEVDHIWPVSLAPDLNYTKSNMQSLCKGCHSRKTSAEKKGLIFNYKAKTITNVESGEVSTIAAYAPQ